VKYATDECLDLRTVFFYDVLENRCGENKEGGRVDYPTVNFCKLAGVRIRVEPPNEEDAHINLDVVFYGGKIRWFSFYQSHENNSVCQMEQENSPEIRRCMQVP